MKNIGQSGAEGVTFGTVFPRVSFAQQAVLGDLRLGPQWGSGLRKQTFWALYRRGLVEPIEQRDFETRWKLTAAGTRVVLALGLMPPPWWLRQSFGSKRLPPAERSVR